MSGPPAALTAALGLPAGISEPSHTRPLPSPLPGLLQARETTQETAEIKGVGSGLKLDLGLQALTGSISVSLSPASTQPQPKCPVPALEALRTLTLFLLKPRVGTPMGPQGS